MKIMADRFDHAFSSPDELTSQEKPSDVWLIGSTEKLARMEEAAIASRLNIIRSVGFGSVPEIVLDFDREGLILAEIDDASSFEQSVLLAELDKRATDARRPVVIACDPSNIDLVVGQVASPYATFLCNPTVAEQTMAIKLAIFVAGGFMRTADDRTDAMRIQQLADEVGRIAQALAGLADPAGSPRVEAVSDGLIGYRAPPISAPRGVAPQIVRADEIRAMIKLRRQRDALFRGDLFADPAWDMMLDLMAARIERLKVAVSSLCIAAAVPPTTALRWIRTLTDIGIFVRTSDPTDGRRIFIELSDNAATSLLNFLAEVKRSGLATV